MQFYERRERVTCRAVDHHEVDDASVRHYRLASFDSAKTPFLQNTASSPPDRISSSIRMNPMHREQPVERE